MVTRYVRALEYLDVLSRKAQQKKVKETVCGDVNYKIASKEPKPLFSIGLPRNMVDLVFHKKKSKILPESSSATTSKIERKVSRFACQKAMSGDQKDKSSKRTAHKTVKIIPGAFDTNQKENNPDVKREFYKRYSQITSKPSILKEKVEYFKITSNGYEHLRKRVDSAKVMVGINGHPSEEETNINPGSVQSKKRIPVSWEDQLLNFPEEVKTIKPKEPARSPQPKNCCENYRILSRLPTSKLVWRQMARPYTPNRWTNAKSMNSPPEQLLPSSQAFIKGTRLKNDLTHRYISLGSGPQAMIDTKIPKLQIVCSKTRVKQPTTTKDEIVSLQICKIRTPRFHTLTIDRPMKDEGKVLQRGIHEKGLLKNTAFKKNHKFTILPLTRPKPFPSDPKVMEKYFHIKKMDTWLQYSSGENKKRKSRENTENLPVTMNNQDLSNNNNGVQPKKQFSFEKENRSANIAIQTDNKDMQIGKLVKPLCLRAMGSKVAAQDVQDKSSQVKNPPVIHFRIPYCGYWNESEMAESRDDRQVMGGNSRERSGSIAKLTAEKRFPDEREKRTQKVRYERPKTR